VLPLNAGENSIRLISATADGGPNIDYLRIERTDEPPADIYTETEPEPEIHKTTIYIAGDSTVQSYTASARRTTGGPIQGWGYFLGSYLTDNVVVSNKAIAGRSSNSYYDQGRLQSILDVIQDGDYLFVQFAINDSAASIAERYTPVCGNVNTPTSGSYEWYMTQFIQGAQKKGATPVLVTTTLSAKNYTNGKFTNSYTAYCDACKNLAKKYNIVCIDLNTLMVNHYNSVGYDTAYSYHMAAAIDGSSDLTHFNDTGANIVAGLVAGGLKKANIPLSKEVK
ncbi:MAG: GDSL family lipase, partial [Oscillospiraceae bacterium]|nr:GDSL family lipase [Oscillospiraceae bacterium]